jgi:adenine phosphoribosyltransferase
MNRIEYGTVKFEVHKQDIKPRSRVLIIDDLLATGGTIVGLTELVRKLKAIVVGVITVVELPELNGIKILAKKNVPCTALIQLPGK